MAKIWTATESTQDKIKQLEEDLNKKGQALFYARSKHTLLRLMSLGMQNVLVEYDEPDLESLTRNYMYAKEKI